MVSAMLTNGQRHEIVELGAEQDRRRRDSKLGVVASIFRA
jgi:hypothetical protein